MEQQIELTHTKAGLSLTLGPNNEMAFRRDLLLDQADWPGWDLRALADNITAEWKGAERWEADRYRLAPGEARNGRRGCVGRIQDGLRADLFFERKRRKGQLRRYCYPIFFVDREPGGSNRQFRIGERCTYGLAYTRAVAHYAKQRNLGPQQTIQALCRIPPRALFFDIMSHRQAQGYELSADRVMAKLGLPNEQNASSVGHAA